MPQQIFDQVVECLADSSSVKICNEILGPPLDAHIASNGARHEAFAALLDQLGERRKGTGTDRDPAVIAPGEHEETLRDPDKMLDFFGGALERALEIGGVVAAGECGVYLGLEDRERSAQLMGCVVDEPAFALVCRLEAIEG